MKNKYARIIILLFSLVLPLLICSCQSGLLPDEFSSVSEMTKNEKDRFLESEGLIVIEKSTEKPKSDNVLPEDKPEMSNETLNVTGESESSEPSDASEVFAEPSAEKYSVPTVENGVPAEKISVPAESYVYNKNTKKFHLSSCSSVKDIKESNKGCSDDRDWLISAGYKPCKKCDP